MSARREANSFCLGEVKLSQARTRLRARKDFVQREYDAAVLRAEARAWKILG
jgi:hypothetical protein